MVVAVVCVHKSVCERMLWMSRKVSSDIGLS